MIGNLMSRMADADKLSVGQLNTAVKNGTIPAYIGVPLIQEKMKAKQAAQAMVGQDQAQPPIAQQVMEQADATTGLEKLQSNLPQQGYAGGGIVAFADGGLAPDDNEDQADEEKALFSRLMEGIAGLKSYEGALAEKGHTPASIRELVRSGPKKGDYVSPPEGGRGHKFESAVLEEAKRQGVDPELALHVLYKETGGLKNPESARSRAGAIGPMQLMPGTARDLGVDPTNPMENIQGGIAYLKQMMNKYQDPVMATAAYNAGPGRVDKAIRSGQGISALPRETQNYVPRMAGGGMVAFVEGGETNPYAMMGDIGMATPEYQGETNYGIKDYFKRKLMGVQDTPKGSTPPTAQELKDFDQASALFEAEQKAKAQPVVTPTAPPVNPMGDLTGGGAEKGMGSLDDIKQMIKSGMEDSAKQKRIDTMLSLLTAGLGIMGGTSQHAAVNIGQGGQQGVGAMLAARKTQAEEQKGLLSAQLGLSRAELYEKMRRDALTQQAAKTKFDQGTQQQRLNLQGQAQQIKLGDLRRKAFEDWDNSPGKTQLETDLAKQKKNWRQDANLLGQYNMMKDRFVNQIVNVGQADGILSSSQL